MISESLSFAQEKFKKNSSLLLIVYVSMFVGAGIGALIPFGGILFSMVEGFIVAIVALKVVDSEEEVTASDIADSLPTLNTGIMFIIGTYILGFVVIIGILLCIIPGLILAYMLGFSPYIILDKKVDFIEAMKISKKITDGYKFDIFVLSIVLGLINIVGFLCCCVGIIVTAPVTALAYFYVYKKLMNNYERSNNILRSNDIERNYNNINSGIHSTINDSLNNDSQKDTSLNQEHVDIDNNSLKNEELEDKSSENNDNRVNLDKK